MSGWVKVESGSVEIEHLSTSSLIKIIITEQEEYEQGKFKEVKKEVWLDYYTWYDLQEAINKTQRL